MPDRNRARRRQRAGEGPGVAARRGEAGGGHQAAAAAPLTAYVDTVSTQPLLDALPTPGTIATTTTNEALGITEWKLSNGVTVVLKPTTFKQDEILFRAVSPGGTSLASDADFVSGRDRRRRSSPPAASARFSSIDLDKMLAGRRVGVSADIGETDEGLRGGARRKDLETMFQLIYLRSPQPRADPAAFAVLTRAAEGGAREPGRRSPDVVFDEALDAALTPEPSARAADDAGDASTR